MKHEKQNQEKKFLRLIIVFFCSSLLLNLCRRLACYSVGRKTLKLTGIFTDL